MLLDINFNFNSGEFFSSDGGWFLPVVIAIGSIVGTVIVQRIYDNAKSDKKLDTLFDYMEREAKKLGDNAVRQADAFAKVSRQLKLKTYYDFRIQKVSAFNTRQIQEWNTAEFSDSIVLRRDGRREDLIGLHSRVKAAFNQADEIEKIIMISASELNTRLSRIQQQWKSHVQSISFFLDRFNMNHAADPIPNDVFLIQYNHLVNEWKKEPEKSRTQMSVVYDMLVDPLIVLCKEHPMDERAFYFIRELHELKSAYQDFTHSKNMYRQWFLDVARKLVRIKVELKNGFEDIQRRKRK